MKTFKATGVERLLSNKFGRRLKAPLGRAGAGLLVTRARSSGRDTSDNALFLFHARPSPSSLSLSSKKK